MYPPHKPSESFRFLRNSHDSYIESNSHSVFVAPLFEPYCCDVLNYNTIAIIDIDGGKIGMKKNGRLNWKTCLTPTVFVVVLNLVVALAYEKSIYLVSFFQFLPKNFGQIFHKPKNNFRLIRPYSKSLLIDLFNKKIADRILKICSKNRKHKSQSQLWIEWLLIFIAKPFLFEVTLGNTTCFRNTPLIERIFNCLK